MEHDRVKAPSLVRLESRATELADQSPAKGVTAPGLRGFRWGGRVRQVNRVVSGNVNANLHDRFPENDRSEDPEPHVVYDLGPDLPLPTIPTSGTYATARVWALLDQMLTQPTLQDAVRASKVLTQAEG